MSILKQIFSITNEEIRKVITILGIKFKIKSSNNMRKIIYRRILDSEEIIKTHIRASQIHPNIFNKYKNCNKGQTVVLCGTAPSLSKYMPIKHAKHIALNRAFLTDRIDFDYLMACDWKALSMVADELKEYKGRDCIKFIGDNTIENLMFPESYLSTFEHERFVFFPWEPFAHNDRPISLSFDLSTQPLYLHCSIAIAAMQFLLWTNPSKIYIVGCDCSATGHFDKIETEHYLNDVKNNIYHYLLYEWQKLKEFATSYYPDVEIISINPVGLKGLFKDVYTNKEGKLQKC